MAKQEIKAKETSGEISRGSQTGGLRRSYDPLGTPFRALDALRFNPLSLMRRFTDEMERVMGVNMWTPAVEVSENNGMLSVRAELPGLKPEEVKLEVDNGVLTLEGERKETQEHTEGGVYRSEHHYGHFYRSVPLPEGADTEHVNARFENGVLEITMPVPSQKAQRRQIPIQQQAGPKAA